MANNIRLNKIRRLGRGSNFLKRNKIDKIAIDDIEKEDTDLDRENTQDADNITERISNLAPDSSQLQMYQSRSRKNSKIRQRERGFSQNGIWAASQKEMDHSDKDDVEIYKKI